MSMFAAVSPTAPAAAAQSGARECTRSHAATSLTGIHSNTGPTNALACCSFAACGRHGTGA
jgi:hypothetical protein